MLLYEQYCGRSMMITSMQKSRSVFLHDLSAMFFALSPMFLTSWIVRKTKVSITAHQNAPLLKYESTASTTNIPIRWKSLLSCVP